MPALPALPAASGRPEVGCAQGPRVRGAKAPPVAARPEPSRLAAALALGLAALLPWGAPHADAQAHTATCEIATAAAPIAGGTVHYSRAGRGPTVLLLHGLFAQKEQWNGVLCALAAAGFDAIAPDLPGFGQSTDFPVTDYDLDRQVELLAALLQALGAGEVDLAANSMGGALAVLFTERHPQTVRRFAFIGPPLGVEDWGPGVQQAIREGVNPFIPIDGPQLDRELALLFAAPPEVPAPVREALIQDYVTRNRHYQQVWDIVNLYDDVLKRPLKVGVPTLILWGESDAIYAVAGAHGLRGQLPHATVVTLPQTGHLPMLERPAETAAVLIPFLRDAHGAH